MADFNIEISGLSSVYRHGLLILLCELFADRRRVIRFFQCFISARLYSFKWQSVYHQFNQSIRNHSAFAFHINYKYCHHCVHFVSIVQNQALSLCLSILLLFAGSILGGTDLLAQFTWYKFTLFPHLNLVAYVNKSAGDAISTLNIPYSVTVIAIYFLICLLISFPSFKETLQHRQRGGGIMSGRQEILTVQQFAADRPLVHR